MPTMNKFFIVYNPKTPKPAGGYMRHVTSQLAEQEAMRLAALQPQDDFYVLEAKSVVRAVRVEVSKLA